MNEHLTAETIKAFAQQIVDLRCQIGAIQATVAKLASVDGNPLPALTLMQEAAEELKEKTLLNIGDTNPVLAEILGIQKPISHPLRIDPPKE